MPGFTPGDMYLRIPPLSLLLFLRFHLMSNGPPRAPSLRTGTLLRPLLRATIYMCPVAFISKRKEILHSVDSPYVLGARGFELVPHVFG